MHSGGIGTILTNLVGMTMLLVTVIVGLVMWFVLHDSILNSAVVCGILLAASLYMSSLGKSGRGR